MGLYRMDPGAAGAPGEDDFNMAGASIAEGQATASVAPATVSQTADAWGNVCGEAGLGGVGPGLHKKGEQAPAPADMWDVIDPVPAGTAIVPSFATTSFTALAAGIVVIWLRSYGGHCGPDVGRGERAACVTFSICATACAAIAVASWFVLLLCRRATFERLAMPACMLMWVLVSASSVAAIFDPDGLGLLPTHVWRGEQPAGPGPVIAAYLGNEFVTAMVQVLTLLVCVRDRPRARHRALAAVALSLATRVAASSASLFAPGVRRAMPPSASPGWAVLGFLACFGLAASIAVLWTSFMHPTWVGLDVPVGTLERRVHAPIVPRPLRLLGLRGTKLIVGIALAACFVLLGALQVSNTPVPPVVGLACIVAVTAAMRVSISVHLRLVKLLLSNVLSGEGIYATLTGLTTDMREGRPNPVLPGREWAGEDSHRWGASLDIATRDGAVMLHQHVEDVLQRSRAWMPPAVLLPLKPACTVLEMEVLEFRAMTGGSHPQEVMQMIQGLVMRMNWVLAPFGLFKYHFSGHRCTFVANYYQDDPNHAFNALMAGLTIVQIARTLGRPARISKANFSRFSQLRAVSAGPAPRWMSRRHSSLDGQKSGAVRKDGTTTLARISTLVQQAEGLPVRVGLHSGPVAAGMVGKLRTNLSLIGPTMNTAAAVNRSLPVGYVGMSAETLKLLPTAVRNYLESNVMPLPIARTDTPGSYYMVDATNPQVLHALGYYSAHFQTRTPQARHTRHGEGAVAPA